jgi:hypothetical protein
MTSRGKRAPSTPERPEPVADPPAPGRPAAAPDPAAPGRPAAAPDPAAPGRAGPDPVTVPIAASVPSALAGIWLVVSRLLFDYVGAGGDQARWNGVVVGGAVTLVAIARMAAVTSSPVLGLVNLVPGGWMIAAPWVYGYAAWGSGSGPAWSDLIAGAVVALAALAGWSTGIAMRSGTARPAG